MPFFGGGSSSPPKSGGNAMGRSGSNQGSAMGRTSSNQGRSGGQVGQTPGAFSDSSSTGSASYFGNNVADDDERSDVPSTVATSVHTGGYDSGNKVGFGVSSQVDNSSKGGQQQGSYGQNNSSTPTPGAYGGQQQSGGQQSGNTGGQQRGQQQTHQQQHQQQQQSGGYVSQQQSGYGNNSLGGQQSYSDAANNSGGNRRDTIASTYEDARENSTMDNQSIMGRGREQSLVEQSGDWSVDQSRMAAGHGNVSRWEQTDAASFLGSDPIAQATDFQDGDIIFVSSEAGAAATRQPPTRFRIHEVNLNVHSAVLSEMVDGCDENKHHQLEEDGATLKLLFGLFYNNPAPALTMSDWQVVLRLARAAQKYDCARAKDVAAAFFAEQEQLGTLSPFMTFAFASMYHLPALEEAAAERSVRYDIHRLPELVFSLMGFSSFSRLSEFHARRQGHYQDALNSIVMDPKVLESQCFQTGGICCIAPWSHLRTKLAWPRVADKDGSKKPPEPADVLRKVITEIGQIDCGTCARALCEAALQAQMALETMPRYGNDEEESF